VKNKTDYAVHLENAVQLLVV